MKNIGVFIVGTSPLPIYISMKHYLKKSVDKVYLLATKDDEFSKGTVDYANKIKAAFSEVDIEIIFIDRSNLKVINKEVTALIEEINNIYTDAEVYLDFTGGTKLQSAVIREKFENYMKDTTRLKLVYVDGYTKKIIIKENNNTIHVEFSDIDGNDEEENISEICKLHGYLFDNNGNEIIITSERNEVKYKFDSIEIEEYTLTLVNTLKNKIEDGKAKVKLEMFEKVIKSEKVGGAFAVVHFKVDEKKIDKYELLKDEFLGIKKDIYEDRVCFIKK